MFLKGMVEKIYSYILRVKREFYIINGLQGGIIDNINIFHYKNCQMVMAIFVKWMLLENIVLNNCTLTCINGHFLCLH